MPGGARSASARISHDETGGPFCARRERTRLQHDEGEENGCSLISGANQFDEPKALTGGVTHLDHLWAKREKFAYFGLVIDRRHSNYVCLID
jgi:hypothetical protein